MKRVLRKAGWKLAFLVDEIAVLVQRVCFSLPVSPKKQGRAFFRYAWPVHCLFFWMVRRIS